MRTITLVELKQTCGGCPSQWEGVTSEGETFYARYRWGNWRIDIDGGTVAEGGALARILLTMSKTQWGRINKLCAARMYGRPLPDWAVGEPTPRSR